MDERPYPEGIDSCWLASDRDGQLGVFLTRGRGPIPALALLETYPLDGLEERLLALPKASDIERHIQMPRSDPLVAFAERGFFVYDWSDAHRTESYIDEYELIALPYRPVTLDQVPEGLAEAARFMRFINVVFANAWRVDPRAHSTCREPRS